MALVELLGIAVAASVVYAERPMFVSLAPVVDCIGCSAVDTLAADIATAGREKVTEIKKKLFILLATHMWPTHKHIAETNEADRCADGTTNNKIIKEIEHKTKTSKFQQQQRKNLI